MDHTDHHQLAAAYFDACQWAETQTADTLRVLAGLTNRTLTTKELRAFARDIAESCQQWRLRVAQAETVLQRACRAGEGVSPPPRPTRRAGRRGRPPAGAV